MKTMSSSRQHELLAKDEAENGPEAVIVGDVVRPWGDAVELKSLRPCAWNRCNRGARGRAIWFATEEVKAFCHEHLDAFFVFQRNWLKQNDQKQPRQIAMI